MKKILIIEDNQIVANVYRNKLAVEDYQVEVTLSGEDGLKLMRAFQPDAIVLDLMLPKMSGIEVIKEIRGQAEWSKLPVIVLSNTYSTNLIQEAWKTGATKCVSKINCSPKVLLELMRSVIGEGEAISHARRKTESQLAARSALSDSESDAAFQVEFRNTFIASLPSTLTVLRTALQNLVKSDAKTEQIKHIQDIYRRVNSINSNACISGLTRIAHMAAALEALLKELQDHPENINVSTLRTVAIAVDFLSFLFEHGTRPEEQEIPPASILIVDDEALACSSIAYALEKARLQSVSIGDPMAALKLLSEKPFDLVFLDVDMPGMSGHDLCKKLRQLPLHHKTPVVFVTRMDDFSSRTKSMMAGGNDFIAKPFLFIELTVKALIHVLRGKLQPAK
jgi:DNA-binding response OmpR family regulator